jgi:hypothetical protein
MNERLFLTTTFSPMMLASGRSASVEEISLTEAREILGNRSWESAVSHEATAQVVTALFGFHIPFNRANLSLDHEDQVVCVIPAFRADVAREFSYDEVVTAGYRVFLVCVFDES